MRRDYLFKMNHFNKIVALLLFIVIAHATVVPHPGPVVSHVPRTYKVSLDDPAEKRWEHIIKDYHEPLTRFMNFLDLLPIPAKFFEGV